jgi:uncharacterized membrane protein
MKTKWIVVGIVGLVALAGVAGYIIAIWSTLQSPVQGAIIGSTGTLLTAAVALFVVFTQLRVQTDNLFKQLSLQAENTRNANRENETMKLKKEQYAEVLKVTDKASASITELANFIRIFRFELALIQHQVNNGLVPGPPSARGSRYTELQAKADGGCGGIIGFVESWAIIDPRLDIFSTGLSSALHDFREAAQAYFNALLMHIPTENAQGMLNPWRLRQQQEIDLFGHLGDQLIDTLHTLSGFTSDFKAEMQMLLLEPLFTGTVVLRNPTDPSIKVIKLADYEHLKAHFETRPLAVMMKGVREARSAMSTPAAGQCPTL